MDSGVHPFVIMGEGGSNAKHIVTGINSVTAVDPDCTCDTSALTGWILDTDGLWHPSTLLTL